MITVNLLPYDLRPIKRTPLPYIIAGTGLLMTLGVIGLSFIAGAARVADATRTLGQHKTELATLQPVVEEYNGLTQKKLNLAVQVNTISEIASDRIIWSRQLFNLNRLALENMWYSDIEVSMKPFTETSLEYNEVSKKNEVITKRIDRQVLTLSGYVIPGDDGQASVSPYTLATESDDEFSSMFQLELSTFKDTLFEDVGVREFQLEYVIHHGGIQND